MPLPEVMIAKKGLEVNTISGKLQVSEDYYEDLYRTSGLNRKELDKFLDGITIPKIMEEHMQSLDRTIIQEIDWEIARLKPGKSPGLDGLNAELYKSVRDLITPHLQELYKYFIRSGRIPGT